MFASIYKNTKGRTKLHRALKSLDSMVGLEDLKAEIAKFVKYCIFNEREESTMKMRSSTVKKRKNAESASKSKRTKKLRRKFTRDFIAMTLFSDDSPDIDELEKLAKTRAEEENAVEEVLNRRQKMNLELLNIIMYGPPGVGKTTLAKKIHDILSALRLVVPSKFVAASRSDLVGEHCGSTAIKTKAIIKKARGGCLFIDEAYSLMSGSRDEFGTEAINTIIAHLLDSGTIFIMAGYKTQMQALERVNSGMASRFFFRFDLKPYTQDVLMCIFKQQLSRKGWKLSDKAQRAAAEKMRNSKSNARFTQKLASALIIESCARQFSSNKRSKVITTTDLSAVRIRSPSPSVSVQNLYI